MKSEEKEKPGAAREFGVMNRVLVVVGILLVVFTGAMIYLFRIYGSIPDTLCTCVFACLGGECGIMGWIKTTKERYKEREWKEEKAEKKAAREESKEVTG